MDSSLTLNEFLDRTPRLAPAMASTVDAAPEEDVFCLDEVWENQRRDNGVWVSAVERGRYSDRLGRNKFVHVTDVPSFGWRVVDDWSAGSWLYGKSFAQLEMQLAQGTSKVMDKGFSQVRWRAWVRQRSMAPAAAGEAREVIAGWLGNKHRRGTWKSRFYVVVTGGPHASADANDNEDSSHDEGEPDEGDDLPASSSAFASTATASTATATTATATTAPATTTAATTTAADDGAPTQSSLVYFRRGFEDVRASFQSGLDAGEVAKLPSKLAKRLRLHSRCRVDAAQGHPTRFYLRFASGYRKTFNAATAEQRDRWIEALSSLLGDQPHASVRRASAIHLGDVVAAMKRGQSELRRGLMPWKRSSAIFQLPPSASASVAVAASSSSPPAAASGTMSSSPSMAVSLPVLTTELVKDAATGSIGVTLSERQGGGVVVESVAATAVELSTGMAPLLGPGDTILGFGGVSLVGIAAGQAMPLIRDALQAAPRGGGVVIEYQVGRLSPTARSRRPASGSINSSPDARAPALPALACDLAHDGESGAIGVTFKEGAAGALVVDAVSSLAVDAATGMPPALAPGDCVLALGGESMQGLAQGAAAAKASDVLARAPRDAPVHVVYASPGRSLAAYSLSEPTPTPPTPPLSSQLPSATSVVEHEYAHGHSNSSVSSSERRRPPHKFNPAIDLASVGPAPANDAGVTRDAAITVGMATLCKLVGETHGGPVSYEQARVGACKAMHLGDKANDAAWRAWFRALFDCVCDNCVLAVNDRAVVLNVRGVDPHSWSPLVSVTDA